MTWEPIHKAHSIIRVRILIAFKESIPIRKLDEITAPTVDNFDNFGFKQKIRVEDSIQNIPINPEDGPISTENKVRGWVINRNSNEENIEEAGLRDSVFGYMTIEYGSWTNICDRFWQIFSDPLNKAIDVVDVDRIRLEYWDRFRFNGDPTKADISTLIGNVDPIIPDHVKNGEFLWDSQAGWFETIAENLARIQRNLEERDVKIDNRIIRTLNINTLVELKLESAITINEIKEQLNCMHKRSKEVFGESIIEKIRKQIGLNLD